MSFALNPPKREKKPTSTTCGVKVMTWGSSPDAGNGMLHFVDTQLFGGNVGHASIQLTFPNNEKGKELLAFCEQNGIPCRAKTVKTLDKDNNVVFQEEVMEAHWSWWPGKSSDYQLSKLSDDRTREREGVPFEWDPKWKKIIAPEERRHKGKVGSRVMAYGPRIILHETNLSPMDREIYRASLEVGDATEKVKSLEILQKKINALMSKAKSDSDLLKLSETEELILNRFFPDWKEKVNSKNLTKLEVIKLLEITKAELRKLNAVIVLPEIYVALRVKDKVDKSFPPSINLDDDPTLKVFIKKLRKNEISKLQDVMNSLDSLTKEGNVEISNDFTKKLDALNQYLSPETWQEKITGPLPTLLQEDIKILSELTQEKLAREVVPSEIDQARADKLLEECNERIKRASSENEYVDRHLKAMSLDRLKDILSEYRNNEGNTEVDERFIKKLDALNEYIKPETWKDKITGRYVEGRLVELTKEDIDKLYELTDEKFKIAEKDVVSWVSGFVHYDPDRDIEEVLSVGIPPDGVVSLPIRPVGNSVVGLQNGLDVEAMLQKMVSLSKDGGFELYTKNCSKTTDAILEAGAVEGYQKDFFRGKAFGFFGNPQQSYNHAVAFQDSIQKGKPGFNPFREFADIVERGGGYLIGVWMDQKSNRLQKGAAVVGGVLLSPVALVVFMVPKILNPLATFKDIMGLMKFANSRNSRAFRWTTNVVLGIIAIPFAPLAALQWGGKLGLQGLEKVGSLMKAGSIRVYAFFMGKPSKKKTAALSYKEANRLLSPEQKERAAQEQQGQQEQQEHVRALHEQFQNLQEKSAAMNKFISVGIKRDIIEVGVEKGKPVSEQAIAALRTFKQILEDPSKNKKIPTFSEEAVDAIQEYIKKGEELPEDELPKDLAVIRVDGKETTQTASELYSKLCAAALERTKEKQKVIAAYQPGSPEFVLNVLLLTKFKVASEESSSKSVVKFSSSKSASALKKEFAFLNKLMEKLRDDSSLAGAEGVRKKAQYLYTAIELVYKDLMASKKLTPREQQNFENKMKQLQAIRSLSEDEDMVLETYLGKVAQATGDRTLVDRCHELIVAEKLREPAGAGPEPKPVE